MDRTLGTLDACRISWGRVLRVQAGELVVERQPLVLIAGKLTLGTATEERFARQIDGRGFADTAAVGDCVSLHWGWVCEVLSPYQRTNLERYTLHHLAIANQTI